uniref:Uncharacterized protein n=1 Tax=Fagus sylvatica TaxID=28930 RepID=A0A2N9FX11_FAGSY
MARGTQKNRLASWLHMVLDKRFRLDLWVCGLVGQSEASNFAGHSLSHGDRQCERVGGKNGKRIVGVGGGWMGIVGRCGGQNGLLEEGEVVMVEVVFVGESGGGG